MKKISYYPGCTLKSTAKNFEDSTLYILDKLKVPFEELDKWYCCGTVFSLTTDNLIHHIAPIRNLVRTRKTGSDTLLTLCSMCYSTLKSSNERVKNNPEELERINNFMWKEETQYKGDVKIIHLLELLKDEIGFETITSKTKKPLNNLNVSSYYGCMLVRPREIAIDDVENPMIMEDLMSSIGAEAIDFPLKTECCASYQTLTDPDIIASRTRQIIDSARTQGAEIISVSCPLCAFNLDQRQKNVQKLYPDFKNMPVIYFTQLLAIALGCSRDELRLDLHHIDPMPILKEKGLF
ncbi:MAG: CoB--CoM heterodisulfide reductase iron-sulfur subunit B family protein [Acidobacteriota bacterium]